MEVCGGRTRKENNNNAHLSVFVLQIFVVDIDEFTYCDKRWGRILMIAKQTNFAKTDFCHRNICASFIGDILHLEIHQYITSHGRASTPTPLTLPRLTPFPFSPLQPLIPSHHHPAVRKVSISLICTPAEKIGAACSASVRKQKHKNRWLTCPAFYRDYAGIGFIFFFQPVFRGSSLLFTRRL